MVFRPSLSIPTLIASILSCISTFGALSFISTRRHTQKSLRHWLVINLLVAEFVNSCNNSISGIISNVNRGVLVDSPSCTANGFIGQFSVQAIDFGVLSIAISTFFIVLVPGHDSRQSLTTRCLACASVWFFGMMTSCIILGLHAFGPVSGNWCWIKSDQLVLRYALAHGWRFTIILAIIVIYACIAIRLNRHFGWLKQNAYAAGSGPDTPTSCSKARSSQVPIEIAEASTRLADHNTPNTPARVRRGSILDKSLHAEFSSPTVMEFLVDDNENDQKDGRDAVIDDGTWMPRRRISVTKPVLTNAHARVVLLMTAYPFFYIILWIPGIANRVVEATGRTSLILQYLQASTQLIGLVDTIIFSIQYSPSRDH